MSDLKITPFLLPAAFAARARGIVHSTLVQDRRDDPLEPHKGIYNTLDLGVAERVFGSQRNFLRFLARNATYHQIGKRLVLARSTEFGDIYAFRHRERCAGRHPAAGAFLRRRRHSHRGFPENQAGPRDTSTGLPARRHGAALQPDGAARFPLIGENIGGVLFHDMGNIYSSLEDFSFRLKQRELEDFDYMVHAVGFGMRYRTPIGPVRVDLGYSINPPASSGSTAPSRTCSKPASLPARPPTAAEPLRAAERQPLLILLFDGADILRQPLQFVVSWWPPRFSPPGRSHRPHCRFGGKSRDHVERLERQIRVSAFLNGTEPDFSGAAKRTAADRLVQQKLIRREMENSRYPVPDASEIDPLLAQLRKDRGGEASYRAALAAAGITEQDLREALVWQRTFLMFLDVRFRPGVQVTAQAIQDYFDSVVAPGARAANPGSAPDIQDYREQIERTLAGGLVDQETTKWLDEARRRTEIVYHQEVFE